MAKDLATAVASSTITEETQVQGQLLRHAARESPASSDSAAHLSSGIPVVDLRRLFQTDGDSGEEEMAKLGSALASWGLFQATGHGIPTSLLNEVRSIGRQFFDLPIEEKQRYSTIGEGFAEGYGSDQIDPENQAIDQTDRILLQVEPEEQRKPELWPDNPVSFRETLHEYAARSKIVVQLILRAMAKSLHLEEAHFVNQMGEKMELFCRFSHYASCPGLDLVLGLKPHSDNSTLTVILQGGDAEGLEILKEDVWIMVPNNPDILVVQVGDIMEIMSNGMFKSSVHRVVTHSEKARISTALFYGPEPDKEIGPAEKLLKEGKRRQYRDLKVKDYLDVHLKSYLQGKRSIDWAKV